MCPTPLSKAKKRPSHGSGSSSNRANAPANIVELAASSVLSLTIGRVASIAIWVPALPPTSNHLWVHTRRNHFRTPEYDAWIWQVRQVVKAKAPLRGRLAIAVDVHFSKKHIFDGSDVDNRVKAVQDALKHAGAIEDDKQFVLQCASKHVLAEDKTFVTVYEVP